MENLIHRIDQNKQRFAETFGEFTAEQLNWKSDTETRSIAQNIRHLILMNESYFDRINELEENDNNAPFLSRFDFMVSHEERHFNQVRKVLEEMDMR